MKDYGEDLQIGIAPNPFKGQLAEVRIWNVARTADQIRTDMDKTIPPDGKVLVWSSSDYIAKLK